MLHLLQLNQIMQDFLVEEARLVSTMAATPTLEEAALIFHMCLLQITTTALIA